MYSFVYIYIYKYVHMYIYTYVYMCIHIYMFTYMCIYIYVYVLPGISFLFSIVSYKCARFYNILYISILLIIQGKGWWSLWSEHLNVFFSTSAGPLEVDTLFPKGPKGLNNQVLRFRIVAMQLVFGRVFDCQILGPFGVGRSLCAVRCLCWQDSGTV